MTYENGGTPAPLATGHVVAVNVGQPREIIWLGRSGMSSIWKTPVPGRLEVRGVNVVGDRQADLGVHGGPDQAVYAYAVEDTEWWAEQLGRSLEPGTFGENLTLRDIDVTNAVIGERWQVGGIELEVTQPRFPCWKLSARMNDRHFETRFADARRLGAYLRIRSEGEIGAGDEVRVISRPSHGVTIRMVGDIRLSDTLEAATLLNVPELGEGMRQWAMRAATRSSLA
ncbi:MAG: MOSC domain-containing protein [Anaerolineae bacterium]